MRACPVPGARDRMGDDRVHTLITGILTRVRTLADTAALDGAVPDADWPDAVFGFEAAPGAR